MFAIVRVWKYRLRLLPQMWGRLGNHERRLNLLEDRIASLEAELKQGI